MFDKLEMVGIGLGALALAGLLLVVKSWKDDAEKLPIVEAQFETYRETTREHNEKREKIVLGIQDENGELRKLRESVPVRVVRLSIPARSVPTAASGSGGSDGAEGPAAGVLPEEAGPDIGGRLYALADEADEVSKQLRACQNYADLTIF